MFPGLNVPSILYVLAWLLSKVIAHNAPPHVITSAATLPAPSESTSVGAVELAGLFGAHNGAWLERRANDFESVKNCDGANTLFCGGDSYCYVGCCSKGSICAARTTCVPYLAIATNKCDHNTGGCVVCTRPQLPACVTLSNVQANQFGYYCDSRQTSSQYAAPGNKDARMSTATYAEDLKITRGRTAASPTTTGAAGGNATSEEQTVLSPAVIVGTAVGTFVGVSILALIIYWICKRIRRRPKSAFPPRTPGLKPDSASETRRGAPNETEESHTGGRAFEPPASSSSIALPVGRLSNLFVVNPDKPDSTDSLVISALPHTHKRQVNARLVEAPAPPEQSVTVPRAEMDGSGITRNELRQFNFAHDGVVEADSKTFVRPIVPAKDPHVSMMSNDSRGKMSTITSSSAFQRNIHHGFRVTPLKPAPLNVSKIPHNGTQAPHDFHKPHPFTPKAPPSPPPPTSTALQPSKPPRSSSLAPRERPQTMASLFGLGAEPMLSAEDARKPGGWEEAERLRERKLREDMETREEGNRGRN